MEKNEFEDRSKEKLKRYLEVEIKKLFTSILDYTEVAVEGKERWKVLRTRILNLSNDARRDIFKEIDVKYSISYVPPSEDVIIIQSKK